jgi:hypothetical protein
MLLTPTSNSKSCVAMQLSSWHYTRQVPNCWVSFHIAGLHELATDPGGPEECSSSKPIAYIRVDVFIALHVYLGTCLVGHVYCCPSQKTAVIADVSARPVQRYFHVFQVPV